MHKPISILVWLLLVSGYSDQWTLTKDKNHITTYIGTPDENGLRPTRSVMLLDENPEQVLQAIQDITSYPDWIPYCEQTKVLSRTNDSTFYYYQFMDMPLVRNRDLIVKVVTTQLPSGYRIDMSVAPTFIPEDEDAVRIEIFSAEYTIGRHASGKTEVSLLNKVDPGGYIPTFALNWASRSQPFETFTNLRNHIVSR